MNFRDFVEAVRDGLEALAGGLEGERTITPMLHLENGRGSHIVGVGPDFFESSAAVELLIERYVLPLIAQEHPSKVAWTYCAWVAPAAGGRPSENPERAEILLATFIDPEVVEHWAASLIRTGGPVLIADWHPALPNLGGGPMIEAIQTALR